MRAPKDKGSKSSKQAAVEKAPPAEASGDKPDIPKGKDLKSSLAAHVEFLKRELTKVRGATANPNMLDNVVVECYGERQSLKDVAQIALKSPLMLAVNPFDSAMCDAVADAIRDADLGLNPSVDGNTVRVPVPKTSKETREANVKLISKVAEDIKWRVRRSRSDALDKLKKAGDGVSEDDVRRDTKVVEELVAATNAEIAKLADKKKLEVEAA